MKIHYIFTVLILTACQGQNSQVDSLKLDNQALKDKLIQLENQNVVYNQAKENTQATLANTEIQDTTSKFNNQKYEIKISYPKNYATNKKKKYPVLYVLDAETNFGGVSYIVQRLIKDKLIPEILVIGIAYNTDYKNFYKLRSRDLTPVEDNELRMGNNAIDPTSGAPNFSDFLENELFPFVEKNYRITKKDRALYGHSHGGLFGSYIILNKPHFFNRYLLLTKT